MAVYVLISCAHSTVANIEFKIEAPLFCSCNDRSELIVLRVTPNLWSRLDTPLGFRDQYFAEHSNDTVAMDWPYLVPRVNL